MFVDSIGDHRDRLGLKVAFPTRRASDLPDDLGIRAMVAAVTACFDISLRHWTERGAEGRFDAVFVEALAGCEAALPEGRSAEHTSALQSLMRTSYAVFGLKTTTPTHATHTHHHRQRPRPVPRHHK